MSDPDPGTPPGSDRPDNVTPAVYDELKRLAEAQFRSQPAGHTLQPTALLNEAYMKLAARPELSLNDSDHFIGLAARVMRQVLVDHARAKAAVKRGPGWERVTLGEARNDDGADAIDVLALEEALEELGRLDERKARLVELRFFGGLTETEAATAIGISRTEATRQWRMVRAWLSKRLRTGDDNAGEPTEGSAGSSD